MRASGVLRVPPASSLRGDPLGRRLAQRELDALAAYARTGDRRQAAALLGLSWHTVKNLLVRAYAKLGVQGAIGAFRALGWLRVPNR